MSPFLILIPFLVASGNTFSLSELHDVNAVAELSNKLAADVHKELSNSEENVFFSPFSISTAMAMLLYGTRGKTAEEMRLALGYQDAKLTDSQVHSAFQSLMERFSEDSAAKEYLLHVANAVLTKKGYPVLAEYKNGLQKIYKATARDVDFENEGKKAVQEINDWVKQKTQNQIDKLLDDIDPSTVMVLLNAVYFKGQWKTKFEHTMEGIFFNKGLETEKVKAPMMYYAAEVPYARVPGAQVIELPYEGDDISMVILLPDALDGLPSLEQKLNPNTLRDLRRLTRKTTVLVTLPKFKLEYEKTLNSVLQKLGIKSVFERSADLSGITEAGSIAVSQVVHKAVVEVNEEGSEASGATGVVIVPVSAHLGIRFIANHPFLFAIVDRRNEMVLFQGRVNKL